MGLGVAPRWRVIYALAVGVLFPLVAGGLSTPTPHSHALAGAALWRAHLACASSGALFAAMVGLLMVRGARGGAIVAPGAAGLAAGVAAGSAGALVLAMKCAVALPAHVALAHWLPMLVCAGLGATSGRRALSP